MLKNFKCFVGTKSNLHQTAQLACIENVQTLALSCMPSVGHFVQFSRQAHNQGARVSPCHKLENQGRGVSDLPQAIESEEETKAVFEHPGHGQLQTPARLWSNRNSHPVLVGVHTGAATVGRSFSQNYVFLPDDPVIPLLCIYPK